MESILELGLVVKRIVFSGILLFYCFAKINNAMPLSVVSVVSFVVHVCTLLFSEKHLSFESNGVVSTQKSLANRSLQHSE